MRFIVGLVLVLVLVSGARAEEKYSTAEKFRYIYNDNPTLNQTCLKIIKMLRIKIDGFCIPKNITAYELKADLNAYFTSILHDLPNRDMISVTKSAWNQAYPCK